MKAASLRYDNIKLDEDEKKSYLVEMKFLFLMAH